MAAIVLLVGLGALFPRAVATAFGTLQAWIADGLGWLYAVAVTTFLVFVTWLAPQGAA